MLTSNQLLKALPLCRHPDLWVAPLNEAFGKYNINSNMRIAAFLAQVGHESEQFNTLIENLNYSRASRLVKIWPKRFLNEAQASAYVNQKEKLGNFVYANRLGNGDASSGDGFRYRGRGLIQITGRSNYAAVGKVLAIDALTQPDLLLAPANAASSAAWFWSSRGLNELADDQTDDDDLEDFGTITQIINGGKTGLQARLALYNAILAVLV
jgi:putative chitinase